MRFGGHRLSWGMMLCVRYLGGLRPRRERMTMSEFDAHEAGGAGMKPSGRTHQEPRLQSIINALGDAADRYGEPPDPDPEDQAKLEAVRRWSRPTGR